MAEGAANVLRAELLAALSNNTDRLPDAIRADLARPIHLEEGRRLQFEIDPLSALGQEDEPTLKNEEQQVRIPLFIRYLREHRETVEYLDLTLEKLLHVLILPPQDEPIFVEMMRKGLGLVSMQDKIAELL